MHVSSSVQPTTGAKNLCQSKGCLASGSTVQVWAGLGTKVGGATDVAIIQETRSLYTDCSTSRLATKTLPAGQKNSRKVQSRNREGQGSICAQGSPLTGSVSFRVSGTGSLSALPGDTTGDCTRDLLPANHMLCRLAVTLHLKVKARF